MVRVRPAVTAMRDAAHTMAYSPVSAHTLTCENSRLPNAVKSAVARKITDITFPICLGLLFFCTSLYSQIL